MNLKLKSFKDNMKDKKIAVLGLGISNRPLIKYLGSIGAKNITGFDRMEDDSETAIVLKEELKDYLSKIYLGENYLNEFSKLKFDYIFKTPILRYDIPELIKAKEDGAVITSEMEVFMELCPANMIAVTGSDGKTTTTTLIYEMLKEEGYKTWLGGNIGYPLLNKIDDISEKDMVVLELSSFQLHTVTVSPHIAVVTNISPNHLDVHKSYSEYMEAKSNIFSHQKASAQDFTVLNYDNPVTNQYSKQVPAAYRFFSRKTVLDKGVYVENGNIYYKKSGEDGSFIMNVNEILLPGTHNVENYLAAISAVINYVKIETVRSIAGNFKGVEHRLELVREFEGVKYYNSSIDSSPSRTIAALGTFKNKIILIAGGKDKGIAYDEIGGAILDKVKILILIGHTSDKIKEAVNKETLKRGLERAELSLEIIECVSYEDVVAVARNKAETGDNVLLSPASTSFDLFRNFEERGMTFKRLVNDLK